MRKSLLVPAIVVGLLIVLTSPASTKQNEMVELGKLPGTTGWTDEGPTLTMLYFFDCSER